MKAKTPTPKKTIKDTLRELRHTIRTARFHATLARNYCELADKIAAALPRAIQRERPRARKMDTAAQ